MLTVSLPLEVIRFAENQGLHAAPDGIEQRPEYWHPVKLTQAKAEAIAAAIELHMDAFRLIIAGDHGKAMLVIYSHALQRLKDAIRQAQNDAACAALQEALNLMAGDRPAEPQAKQPRNPQPKQKGLF